LSFCARLFCFKNLLFSPVHIRPCGSVLSTIVLLLLLMVVVVVVVCEEAKLAVQVVVGVSGEVSRDAFLVELALKALHLGLECRHCRPESRYFCPVIATALRRGRGQRGVSLGKGRGRRGSAGGRRLLSGQEEQLRALKGKVGLAGTLLERLALLAQSIHFLSPCDRLFLRVGEPQHGEAVRLLFGTELFQKNLLLLSPSADPPMTVHLDFDVRAQGRVRMSGMPCRFLSTTNVFPVSFLFIF
jgi:hypothetical protein